MKNRVKIVCTIIFAVLWGMTAGKFISVAFSEFGLDDSPGTMYPIGDTITLGRYTQDALQSDFAPIEWIVIDQEGSKRLLLSKYGLLFGVPFNENGGQCPWEYSSIRRWLNVDFISLAFTAEEKSLILEVETDNSERQGFSEWKSPGSRNTRDRVFLLSGHEAFEIYFETNQERVLPSRNNPNNETGRQWMTRSPGRSFKTVMEASYDGHRDGHEVDDKRYATRPAMWIDLEIYNQIKEKGHFDLKEGRTSGDIIAFIPVVTSTPAPTLIPIHQKFDQLSVGDVVKMGYYEQDGNDVNLEEPITWRVLDVDSKSRKALLLSEYGLEARSYGRPMYADEYTNVGLCWANCYLNEWLNRAFYSKAFTEDEKKRILTTTNSTSDSSGKFTTDDKVFILSINEVKKYLKKPTEMACIATEHAKKSLKLDQGAITDDGYCMWWIRDMVKVARKDKNWNLVKNTGNEAGYIYGSKGLNVINRKKGGPVFCDYLVVVRPALWIQLD